MQKVKSYFKNLKNRLKVCWRILFGKYNHYVIINVNNDDFDNFTRGYAYDIDFHYMGMNNYLSWSLVKEISTIKSDTDMILDKILEDAKMEYEK